MAIQKSLGMLFACGPQIFDIHVCVIVHVVHVHVCVHTYYFVVSTDAFSDNILCHFCASMISGLVTTLASMPVDIAKTR